MHFPEDLKYTKEHEWIKIENDEGVIGITDYAQDQLGDIVYVELPEAGETFNAMESFGSIDSVKTSSELYIPVSGEVIEVNEDVIDRPELVNEDPYGKGWLIKIRITNPEDLKNLLDASAYRTFIENL